MSDGHEWISEMMMMMMMKFLCKCWKLGVVISWNDPWRSESDSEEDSVGWDESFNFKHSCHAESAISE